MAKGNHRLKMGWFGWSVVSVIIVTILGSFLFFFNIFGLNATTLFTDEQSGEGENEPASEETLEKVKKVQETVGKEHADVGQFVSDTHDFYNETTGYGGISSLEWDKQRKKADTILATLKKEFPNVQNEALQTDLNHIKDLAEGLKKEESTERVRLLHRMFHDLDIGLNSYNGSDKIWSVTETLKKTSN